MPFEELGPDHRLRHSGESPLSRAISEGLGEDHDEDAQISSTVAPLSRSVEVATPCRKSPNTQWWH